jgi:hypothetical protein
MMLNEHWYGEKLCILGTLVLSSASSLLGSIYGAAELRWIHVTLTFSILVAGLLALGLHKQGDTLPRLVSRIGVGIFGGVILTKMSIHWMDVSPSHKALLESDVLYLGGTAALFSGVCYVMGFALIQTADQSASTIAKKILDWVLSKLK